MAIRTPSRSDDASASGVAHSTAELSKAASDGRGGAVPAVIHGKFTDSVVRPVTQKGGRYTKQQMLAVLTHMVDPSDLLRGFRFNADAESTLRDLSLLLPQPLASMPLPPRPETANPRVLKSKPASALLSSRLYSACTLNPKP